MELTLIDLKELLKGFFTEEESENLFYNLAEYKTQKIINIDLIDLKDIFEKIKKIKNQQLYYGKIDEKNVVVEIKSEFLDGAEYICQDYHSPEIIYHIGQTLFLNNFKPVIYKIGQTINDGLFSKIAKLFPTGYETKNGNLSGFIPFNFVEKYEYKSALFVIGD